MTAATDTSGHSVATCAAPARSVSATQADPPVPKASLAAPPAHAVRATRLEPTTLHLPHPAVPATTPAQLPAEPPRPAVKELPLVDTAQRRMSDGAAISRGETHSPVAAAAAHNLAAPVNDKLVSIATPQAVVPATVRCPFSQDYLILHLAIHQFPVHAMHFPGCELLCYACAGSPRKSGNCINAEQYRKRASCPLPGTPAHRAVPVSSCSEPGE